MRRIPVWSLAFALAIFPTLAGAQSPVRAFPPGTFQSRGAIDAAGGGGVTFSLTYTDNRADTGTTASITYNAGGNPSCGAADANRIVVVGMGRRIDTANRPTSVTIGGVSATAVSGAFIVSSGAQQSDIWYAAVPTGTTCSVVIQWDAAGANFGESGIGIYRLITATPTPTTSATNSATSGSLSVGPYTVPAGGASLNFVSLRDGTGAPSIDWTNTSAANGDFENQPGTRAYGASTVLSAGSVTVTAAAHTANVSDITLSAAAWGP